MDTLMSTGGVSMTNLVNLSNLERVFQQIFEQLAVVTTRLDTIENEIAKKNSISSFLSLKHECESNSSLFENRIHSCEDNLSQLNPLLKQTQTQISILSKIREQQASNVLPKLGDLESNFLEIQSQSKLKFEDLYANKCNKNELKKLNESQNDICSQMCAIESMLQCKVDRSQISLLESYSKQLSDLEYFRTDVNTKLFEINEEMKNMFENDLEQRLRQMEDAFNEKCLALNDNVLLESKKDMHLVLHSEWMPKISLLSNDLSVLLSEHKQISNTECFNHIQQNKSMNHKMQIQSLTNAKSIQSLTEQCLNFVSISQLDKKADRTFIEQTAQEIRHFCRDSNTTFEMTLHESQSEIEKLKKTANTLTEKISVALRFVDWYSSVQLNA